MSGSVNIRERALDVLLDVESGRKLSHVAMGDTMMQIAFESRADRAFFRRLCQGVLERRIYLDYVLDSFSKTKMKKCKPLIRNLLRMSAYQIIYMNVPDSAACNEAVKLAKKRGFSGLSGFVNGVLRSLIRSKDKLPVPDRKKDEQIYLSVMYSMPLWIVQMLSDQYGRQTEGILDAFNRPSPLTVRTNLSKISTEELRKQIERAGIAVEEGSYLPYALKLGGIDHISRVPGFREGYFTVQDESSMLVVACADIREGDRVLDLCAAPGGKSFHAADRLGKGLVISRDVSEAKTALIEENNARMGYDNMQIEVADARVYDPALENSMDVVLCDLPCSGMGIMGRKSDIRYNLDPAQPSELAALQREILSVAWHYVRPGGRLIYSTCTLNQGENVENAAWIRENTPLKPISIEADLPEGLQGRTGTEGYIQLVPGKDACDGFFIAAFVK